MQVYNLEVAQVLWNVYNLSGEFFFEVRFSYRITVIPYLIQIFSINNALHSRLRAYNTEKISGYLNKLFFL